MSCHRSSAISSFQANTTPLVSTCFNASLAKPISVDQIGARLKQKLSLSRCGARFFSRVNLVLSFVPLRNVPATSRPWQKTAVNCRTSWKTEIGHFFRRHSNLSRCHLLATVLPRRHIENCVLFQIDSTDMPRLWKGRGPTQPCRTNICSSEQSNVLTCICTNDW